MVLIVGVTGPLGAGKGTVIDVLAQQALQQGIQVIRASLSDEIRFRLRLERRDEARETLKETADLWRLRLGNGVWAMLAAFRIEEQLERTEARDVLVLVDAVRNPGEVQELRSWFGSSFRLLGVTAPLDVIRRNLLTRRRVDESATLLQDNRAVDAIVEAELGIAQPDHGHNVRACLALCDWPVIENSGSLSDLADQVRALTRDRILAMFPGTD